MNGMAEDTMSDALRLEALKNLPHLVKQHGGCCGFAATLMALLIHAPDEVDALYDTVDTGQGYRGIRWNWRGHGHSVEG